jgi:hypothetical protein
MKITNDKERTGLSTMGLAGVTILAGVIFTQMSPWWLIASGLLILMGTGLESGVSKEEN